jgi:DNA recombination protein RmuC
MLLTALVILTMIVVLGFAALLYQVKHHDPLADKLKAFAQDFNLANVQHIAQLKQELSDKLADQHLRSQQNLQTFKEQLQKEYTEQRSQLDAKQLQSLQTIQDSLQKGRVEIAEQVRLALSDSSKALSERVEKLTQTTETKLKDISGQVEKRLSEGFEKTTATFTDIIKRLALIDEAQKKMAELSNNVVSLQDILMDKRSRGAFGEVQLNSLIRNVLPEKHFELQATLSNDKRADCILYLPKPTGNIVIDAKFPLENYRRLTDNTLSDIERKQAEQLFKRDVKAHIDAIASKYIIANETADGAIMFIPAESIFAEIHAHHPDLIDLSHKSKVWLVSPTTMMAILTTIRAVLKDEATREQASIIQHHLRNLAKDFERFQKRMDALQKHIEQANQDVQDVNVSAKKITSGFEKIEKVELIEQADKQLLDFSATEG